MTDSEYVHMRVIVAEWIANARMGYGTDPNTLIEQLKDEGLDLTPEFDEMEEE